MTPYRHRPRDNMAVNQYWMCDEGMLSYSRVTKNRMLEPRVGGKPSTLEAALAEAKRRFSSVPKEAIAIVLSAQHSNEDNFALRELATSFLGATQLFVSGKPKGKRDDILMHEDKNPNTAGVKNLAPLARPFEELLERVLGGVTTHVIALGADLPGPPELLEAPIAKLAALVTIASHDGPLTRRAHAFLPACTWAEAEGTYVNSRGMAQRSERAVDPKGASRPAWELVAALGEALGYATRWKKLKEVRKAMEPEAAATAGVSTAYGPPAGA
jgi:NADH-quinone oxidoreductase subunit G